jgi:hypothetical protein
VVAILFPSLLIAVVFSRCDDVMPRLFLNADGSGDNSRDDSIETSTSSETDSDFEMNTDDSADCVPLVYTFINGVNDYLGCTDVEIYQHYPDGALFFADNLVASTVRDVSCPYTSRSQILIRMSDIFGNNPNQIPINARITSASLKTYTRDGTLGNIAAYKMSTDWDSGTTWNMLGGVTPNGIEAAAEPDDVLSAPHVDRFCTFDVTRSLIQWQPNPVENRGWVIMNSGEDGWGISSCENDVIERRPRLEIEICGTIPDRSQNLPPEILVSIDSADGPPEVSGSTILDIVAVDADSDPLDVTFYGREKGTDFWTLIVLPDTQYYTVDSEWPKGIFLNQMQWIVNNREALNIQMVLSAGDLVEDGRIAAHWERANEAISMIIDADIPYMPTPGDHDHEGQKEYGALTLFSETFPETRFSDDPWWGGTFDETNSSHYVLLTIGPDDYIFMGLDFCPDLDEIDWANDILDQYSDRKAIFITHALLDDTGNYYATGDCGRYNGESVYIWDMLASRHDNLNLALSGHMHLMDGEYRRTDDNIHGIPVHQVISDYQGRWPDWGNGLLRIMTFYPSEDEIWVQTYSPYLDEYETDADSQFILPFEMEDERPFRSLGTVSGVSSGEHATLYWSDLNESSAYEWYAVVSDGAFDTKSPMLEFETAPEI